MAGTLKAYADGVDERPVVPVSAPAKSYSQQETFATDQTDEEFIEATLRRMADKLMAKVREDGKSVRTLTVKVRYNDMDEEQAEEQFGPVIPVVPFTGIDVPIRAGDLADADAEIVKKYPTLFTPAHIRFPAPAKGKVEQATRAPGEKRG